MYSERKLNENRAECLLVTNFFSKSIPIQRNPINFSYSQPSPIYLGFMETEKYATNPARFFELLDETSEYNIPYWNSLAHHTSESEMMNTQKTSFELILPKIFFGTKCVYGSPICVSYRSISSQSKILYLESINSDIFCQKKDNEIDF